MCCKGGSEYSTGTQHQHRCLQCKQEGPTPNHDHASGWPQCGSALGLCSCQNHGHVAEGIRVWELEEEQSVVGISIPSTPSWQAPRNRQAKQTELAASIYGETVVAPGLPTFHCSRTECPTYSPAVGSRWALLGAGACRKVLGCVGGCQLWWHKCMKPGSGTRCALWSFE